VLAICIPMILYTTIGGVQAVAWTDVKQMFLVVGGMSAAVAICSTASCSTWGSCRRSTWRAPPAG
jgi:Na+/proline symporter